MNCFLSYGRRDALEFARELHRRFIRDGINCFFDEHSIEWGTPWVRQLEQRISEADHVIIVLSPGFLDSEWASAEWMVVQTQDPAALGRKMLPLLYKPCEVPGLLSIRQHIDVQTTEAFEAAYPKICTALGGKLQPDLEPVDMAADTLPPLGKLPARHRMPYRSLGGRFTGRIKTLYTLHEHLIHANSTSVGEGVGVLAGTGGLGKTQLAIEYVHRLGQYYTGGVYWINANQPLVNVQQDIATYAEIDLDDRLEPQARTEQLWRNLAKLSGNILIVYDNLPLGVAFSQWLPASPAQIKVLVTTQRRDLDYPTLVLPFMTAEESLTLINSGERQIDTAEAQPLIEKLGGLPLALELTRNYLNRRVTLTVPALLQEMLDAGNLAVLDQFVTKYTDELPTGHEKEVSATFQLSWAQASGTEQAILALMAQWTPGPVPRRLIHRAISNDPSASGLYDPIEEAVDELERLSLVDFDADKDPKLHRLMHGFIQEIYRRDDTIRTQAIGALSDEMGRANDEEDTAAINDLEKVVDHAQYVIDHHAKPVEALINLASYTLSHHCKRGRFELARRMGEIALARSLSFYEPGHDEIATCQSNLAQVLYELGDYETARGLLEQAVATDAQRYEPGHPIIAITQSNFAMVLQALGEYEDARALLEQALASAEEHYEPGHPTIALRQSYLATVLQELDEYEAARGLLDKALAAAEKHYESGHPTIAGLQSLLAIILRDLGEFETARDLLEQALAADEQHFEPGHPTIATHQCNLATVYQDLGEFEAARGLLELALKADEQRYERGHPTIAITQSNLAMVLQALGEYEAARGLLEQVLASHEQHYESRHPTIATSQSNLALVLQDLGEYEAARGLLEQALATAERLYEAGHPTIAARQSNLAMVLRDLGELEAARNLLKRALAIVERRYNPGHPKIATIQSTLTAIEESLK